MGEAFTLMTTEDGSIAGSSKREPLATSSRALARADAVSGAETTRDGDRRLAEDGTVRIDDRIQAASTPSARASARSLPAEPSFCPATKPTRVPAALVTAPTSVVTVVPSRMIKDEKASN
jgi:hypothetical protein